MTELIIPPTHPRAESLLVREKLIEGFLDGFVTEAGLIAHGRGETFDYLLGEATLPFAAHAARMAAAVLLLAKNPVICVNGNTAALCPHEIVQLSKATTAKVEVNLFYHSRKREQAIQKHLLNHGASKVYGVDETFKVEAPELYSNRRFVDLRATYGADTVLIPLEDGDRTTALKKLDKFVIAIDLNPLSRTAQAADVTIVDNVVRAMPAILSEVKELTTTPKKMLKAMISAYNNKQTLSEAVSYINGRLSSVACQLDSENFDPDSPDR